MSINEEVELLQQIPLFAKIEPSKLKLLAFTSERLKFRDDEVVFSQNDIGDAAYIIIGGEADVILSTDDGSIPIATLQRNDIVGEIAILCDVPRTATVRAKGELEVLRISKDLFFRMVGEFPQMAVEIMRELALRLNRTTDQLMKASRGDK